MVVKWMVTMMANTIGAFVAFVGALFYGWQGNLPMVVAMAACLMYFKE